MRRDFCAEAPNRLWLADLTSVRTWSGIVSAAFVVDAFSRFTVGWQTAAHLRTGLVLDALEMTLWRRQGGLDGLVHHGDRGGEYLSIRGAQRLAEAGVVTSVGSRGDSYESALAQSVIGLHRTELIRRHGPWKNLDSVEYATLEWVDWFNQEYYRQAAQREQEALRQMSLH